VAAGTGDHYTNYYDAGSVKKLGSIRVVWVNKVFDRPQNFNNNLVYTYNQAKWEIDCQRDTAKITQIAYYNKGNLFVVIEPGPGVVEIGPDSMGSLIEGPVCK